MSAGSPPLKILIIDDSPEDRELYRRLLTRDPDESYAFVEAETGEEGVTLCQTENPDFVLLDYRLPGGWDGIRLAHRLGSELNRQLPVILITGDTAVSRLREVKLSELPVLHKPINIDQLRGLIEEVAPRNIANPKVQRKNL